jgi:hypothetical protein
MYERVLRAIADRLPASGTPWYRRADAWLLVGAIVLPFGWILAVARIAWAWVMAWRARRRAARAFPATLPRPEGEPTG